MKRVIPTLVISLLSIFVAVPAASASVRSVLDVRIVDRPHPELVVQQEYPRFYRVRPGDTLSKIASREYGNGNRWPALWWTNQRRIANPNELRVGQKLRISGWHPHKRWVLRRALQAVPRPKPIHASTAPQQASTVSAPAPAPSGSGCGLSGTLSFAQLEQLWECGGGPSWADPEAATVAECESGGNQFAYNPSGASGYWQILGQVVGGYIFNPMVNVLNAVSKFKASGDTFAQWVCRP